VVWVSCRIVAKAGVPTKPTTSGSKLTSSFANARARSASPP
jgi:hypothetical protein